MVYDIDARNSWMIAPLEYTWWTDLKIMTGQIPPEKCTTPDRDELIEIDKEN